MYKILIVDDEPMSIHSLSRQINWQSYAVELAGTTETSESALDILRQKHIDILFTDIRMPRMDGLNLISAAKQLNPFIRSVVISAHNEFDYVKKALLLGVENYMLKPIDQKELDETLKKTIDNLDRDRVSNEKNMPNILSFRNNILDRWLNAAIQDYEFYERAEMLHIDLSARRYQVCVADITNACSVGQKLLELRWLLDLCKKNLSIAFDGEYLIDRFNRLSIILNGRNLDKKQNELMSIIHTINVAAQDNGTSMFTCIGAVSDGMENVAHDYAQAIEYLNYRFINPDTDCVFYDACMVDFKLLGCESLLVMLSQAFIDESAERANAITNKFLYLCIDTPLAIIKKCMVPFIIMLASRINDVDCTAMPPSVAAMGFAEINTIDSSEALGIWFIKIINQALDVILMRKKSFHLLIQRTLDILKNEYHTDQTLKNIAADFKVTPAYLGQLFKDETGKYFNDYLTETRLQASRTLLLETDLKVRDILRRIGIPNQSYYNKIFKKAYGLSPIDFRRYGNFTHNLC